MRRGDRGGGVVGGRGGSVVLVLESGGLSWAWLLLRGRAVVEV